MKPSTDTPLTLLPLFTRWSPLQPRLWPQCGCGSDCTRRLEVPLAYCPSRAQWLSSAALWCRLDTYWPLPPKRPTRNNPWGLGQASWVATCQAARGPGIITDEGNLLLKSVCECLFRLAVDAKWQPDVSSSCLTLKTKDLATLSVRRKTWPRETISQSLWWAWMAASTVYHFTSCVKMSGSMLISITQLTGNRLKLGILKTTCDLHMLLFIYMLQAMCGIRHSIECLHRQSIECLVPHIACNIYTSKQVFSNTCRTLYYESKSSLFTDNRATGRRH